MKLFERKQYVIAAIIIVLTLTLAILNSKAQAQDSTNTYPVMSEQFGPLTYVIAIEKECSGFGVAYGTSRWVMRPDPDCKIKYHHLIGKTGKKLALMGVTERMPTETMMRGMLHRYLAILVQGTR